MIDVTFSDLAVLYENTAFELDGEHGTLSIRTDDVLRIARLVHQEGVTESPGLAIVGDVSRFVVGQTAEVIFGPPKSSIGRSTSCSNGPPRRSPSRRPTTLSMVGSAPA
jgi:hypothetical protein